MGTIGLICFAQVEIIHQLAGPAANLAGLFVGLTIGTVILHDHSLCR